MTERKWYRVMVVRGDWIIDERYAPTGLADAYANVLRLRYPNDEVRAEEVTADEAAYPPNRPYDPRD